MKLRQTYWRRKGKKIIAEGKLKGRTIYLFTLPDPDDFLRRIRSIYEGTPKFIKKSSFLSRENLSKNLEIISRLDSRQEKQKKTA